ncbi:hypothetical protein OQA88_562 [Cercophora sp. LCS_1]
MSSLKRKEGPGGSSASKTARPASESRPSKRPKPSGSTKDDTKSSAKKGKDGKQSKSDAPKPSSNPTVSLLKDEEPLFPRGGASVLSPLEQKQIQIQAKKDVLFEQESSAAGKKKVDKVSKKKKRKSEADVKPAQSEDSVKIESLNFKRLVRGSLVLGTVCAINNYDISIALPNNLVGHVPITMISNTLTQRLEAMEARVKNQEEESDSEDVGIDLNELFRVGQYLRAYVLSTIDESGPVGGKSKKHIKLSLRPEDANSGLSAQDVVPNATLMASVASVEDHGFVMDVNLEGSTLRGFLSKKQLDKSISEDTMQQGAVMLCMATGKPANGKVVQLSTLADKLGSVKAFPAEATTIGTFLPGTAVDALISDISQHGLVGKVMGDLDVTADLVHSGAGPDGVDLQDKYKIGSRVKARVICSFPEQDKPKRYISLLPHVAALKPKVADKDGEEVEPLETLPHSTKIDKCTVERVEPGIGLFVDVGISGVPGFVHISKVKDGKVDGLFENSGPFKVGSVHPGRVIGYNSFDGTYLISFEKGVIEQPFLRVEDIPIGAVVSGVVEKLVVNEFGFGGVLVNIADGISGLVPTMHLSDVQLQNPEKKFREGMKVKTRVLSTDPSKRQVRLTLKKTLVNSDAPAIQSYDELAVGLQAPGTIVALLQHGAIVQFYGELKGFLPISEMSEAYIRDPKEHFRVGQTITIYVSSFDPDAEKLFVSCKDPSAFGLEKQLALKKLQIGDLVTAKVTQKTDNDVFVELADGSLKAILPVGHLTDKSVSKTQSALKKIHVGQTLTDLVVLQKNEGRRSITVSQKPSLVKASKEGNLLKTIEDVRVDAVVNSFVKNITPTAAFVQFAGMLSALLPKSLITPEAQNQPSFGMHTMQSLEVKVVSIDRDLGRFVVAIPGVAPEKKEEKPVEKAVNAIDSSITSVLDLTIGKITQATVASVKETQLNVRLADNIQGRIDISQVYDNWNDISNPKKPLKDFQPKQVVPVRVLGVHDARNHRFLPITHRSSHSVLELSAKLSDLKEGEDCTPLALDAIKVGSTYIGFVNNVEKNNLWVNLSPAVRGRINASEASDDLADLMDLSKSFPIGSALKVRVLAVDVEKQRLDLSARTPGSENQLTWQKVEPGMVLVGRITKLSDNQVLVHLSDSVAGPIFLPDLADDFDEANTLKHAKHELIRVAVVDVDRSNKKIRLSARPSRVLNASLPVKDREITKNSKLEVGEIIRGFVKNVSDKGLFVALGGDVVAMVQIRNLSDAFLKEWKDHFQVDQIVKGRIISIAEGRIEMSLKQSVVEKDFVPLLTFADLKVGQVVTGRVRKVEHYGAFIDIDGSANVSGLCHRSEMTDRPKEQAKTLDARSLYNEKDKVKATVLQVDAKQKKISLGLKPSYFKDDDYNMDVDDDEGAPLDSDADSDEDEDEDMSDAGEAVITGTDTYANDSDDSGEDGEDDSDVEMGEQEAQGATGLDAGGFDWNAAMLDGDAGSKKRVAAGDDEGKKKKQRREPRIQVDKTAELDINGPQTSSDFERLLLGQPNDSTLWIQYIAFQYQVGDLDAARKVAERAIKTINMKEEAEKLNVWIAYLNLEVSYGTDETLDDVFKRACTYNDEQEVYERLASIYIQSGKHSKAEDLFDEKILKKFGSKSVDVWVNYAHFLHTKLGKVDKARELLKRASQVLGTQAHLYLALVPKFAALEFRSPNGDRDQGRTLFESLLATYPKKFDLWNQLLDLEISTAGDKPDVDVIRDLFGRGTKAKGLKPKQAKAWFKRWATWEESRGDSKGKERVAARAQEWVRAKGKKEEVAGDDEE